MATSVERPLEPDSHLPNEHHLTPKHYAEAVVQHTTNGAPKNPIESDYYSGNGEAKQSPTNKGLRKKLSNKDTRNKLEKTRLVEEKRSNGSLVSVAKDAEYEESLELDEMEQKPSRSKSRQSTGTQLVSGRQPGAGWERSG